MDNKGKITVFLSLMVNVFLVLGLTALQVISVHGAKAKATMCTRTALSDIQAGYNRYIFDNYHILLFDKNGGGYGEGYIEEQIIDNLTENLGDAFEIDDVQVTKYTMLTDDNCQPFKMQIADYIKYAAIESGFEYILDATDGKDGTLSDSVFEQPMPEMKPDIESMIGSDKADDPRRFTSKLQGGMLLSTVAPADLSISDYQMIPDDMVSFLFNGINSEIFEINSDFNDFDTMRSDLFAYGTWADSLLQDGIAVAYATQVFNHALNQEVNETAVLSCELEYLICGLPTDRENLKGVINKIIGIRMPINYAFLMMNTQKKSLIVEVSVPIATLTLVPLPVVEQLIAGCWAYAESVAEVRYLMHGHKMSFAKTNENWITDLENIGTTVVNEGKTDEKGLGYKDYLMILLAINNDKSVYRMLDLMQANARQENDDFRILNSAVGLRVDATIESEGKIFFIREDREY